jgi:hypothetical protein
MENDPVVDNSDKIFKFFGKESDTYIKDSLKAKLESFRNKPKFNAKSERIAYLNEIMGVSAGK